MKAIYDFHLNNCALFQLENGFIQYMCVFGTTSRPAQQVNSTVVMCDGQVRTCDCNIICNNVFNLFLFPNRYHHPLALVEERTQHSS